MPLGINGTLVTYADVPKKCLKLESNTSVHSIRHVSREKMDQRKERGVRAKHTGKSYGSIKLLECISLADDQFVKENPLYWH